MHQHQHNQQLHHHLNLLAWNMIKSLHQNVANKQHLNMHQYQQNQHLNFASLLLAWNVIKPLQQNVATK